jgi:hypothetical protein
LAIDSGGGVHQEGNHRASGATVVDGKTMIQAGWQAMKEIS